MKITIELDDSQVKEILGFLEYLSIHPEFEHLRNLGKKDVSKEIPWMLSGYISETLLLEDSAKIKCN